MHYNMSKKCVKKFSSTTKYNNYLSTIASSKKLPNIQFISFALPEIHD